MSTATEDIDLDTFKLTADQEAAFAAFQKFLIDPSERFFVLRGFAGCGKSTLVQYILKWLPTFHKTQRLLNPDGDHEDTVVELTATTNKAAENLAFITGWPCKTIHSLLGIRPVFDPVENKSFLDTKRAQVQWAKLIFIDEASYIDGPMLKHINHLCENSKVVFLGDPAQLTPVKSSTTPVFDMKVPGAALTEVVRQAKGNPIIELATAFRNTVNSGQFFSFKPDGHHIAHMPRPEFEKLIVTEFSRPEWKFRDSKVLCWTNKRVIDYNKGIRSVVKGDPHFEVGDYAVVNSFVNGLAKGQNLKTDQLVQITDIGGDVTEHGVEGNWFQLDKWVTLFMPKSLQDKKERLKKAQAAEEYSIVQEITKTWVDLRAAYACTINKSQGSTFDRVFIDLDDIRACNSGDQIARMLYVAVSRARHHVYLTGDIA